MLRVGLPYRQGQRQKSPLNFWLVGDAGPRDVKIVAESFEEGINFRMRYRVRIFLGDQILFGHVGDIGTLGIFRQQVVTAALCAAGFRSGSIAAILRCLRTPGLHRK